MPVVERNCYLLSRRFNPGHLSHLVANYKMLSETGYKVRLFWHNRFNAFCDHEYDGCLASRSDMLCAKKEDLVIVWFPSLAALMDMIVVRLFTKATVVYVFHEPFTSLSSYKDSGFGILKTGKIAIVSLINYALVSVAHKVLLPSRAALSAYRTRYNTEKPHAQFPLMFDDEAIRILPKERRQYISYIGTVAEDHAFDEFVRFACWGLENGRLGGYKVLIATRSALKQSTIDRLQPYVDSCAAVIQSGRPLSNEEINECFSRSIVVWNAYRRSMQSGILPKAYMFGTPVIITSVNRSEFFVDKVTGIEVSSDYDVNDISSGISSIVTDFSNYSKACRAVFCESYYYRSFARSFIEFVASEENEGTA